MFIGLIILVVFHPELYVSWLEVILFSKVDQYIQQFTQDKFLQTCMLDILFVRGI